MKKSIRLITSLSLLTLATTIVLSPVSVIADQVNTVVRTSEPVVTNNGYRLSMIDGQLIQWPVDAPTPTEAEIQAIRQERGKWSTAVQMISKGYRRVPAKVRNYINKYIGLNVLLGALDHWTGWIEDGIDSICKGAGIPDWMAWTVAKALTMAAF